MDNKKTNKEKMTNKKEYTNVKTVTSETNHNVSLREKFNNYKSENQSKDFSWDEAAGKEFN